MIFISRLKARGPVSQPISQRALLLCHARTCGSPTPPLRLPPLSPHISLLDMWTWQEITLGYWCTADTGRSSQPSNQQLDCWFSCVNTEFSLFYFLSDLQKQADQETNILNNFLNLILIICNRSLFRFFFSETLSHHIFCSDSRFPREISIDTRFAL